MRLVEGLLRQWQHATCNHRWVRARWDDGSYGLRCSRCMAAYAHTWEDVIGTQPKVQAMPLPPAELVELHRAA